MAYSDDLRRVWHEYERENNMVPASARDAVRWGVQKGMIVLREVDPSDAAAEAMARALRAEVGVDHLGHRYRKNHNVTVTRNGVQITIWAHIDNAPRDFMEKSLGQRRKQVVGDLMQLRLDTEAYNLRAAGRGEAPLQLDFDFTEEIESRFRPGSDDLFGAAA